MPDAHTLSDDDVRKLRSLLGAADDDAFALGVTLLEACQPTAADDDVIFNDELLQAVVASHDARRWEALIAVLRGRRTVMQHFHARAVEAIRSCGYAAIRLASLTEMSTELAAIVASHHEHLHAKVTTLSTPAAWALAKCRGWLHLDELRSISPDVAVALASHKGLLSLCGLTTLSRDDARSLAMHAGTLHLDGIMSLARDVAEELARHRGEICLRGMTSLPRETAAALAKHEFRLSLEIEEITDDAATELAFHRGPGITIGLSSLSAHAARVLADDNRDLTIHGLGDLSIEAARALADGAAKIKLHIDSISTEAETVLRGSGGRWHDHITLEQPFQPWFGCP